MFKVLGQPRSAVRVILNQGQNATVNCEIAAINTDTVPKFNQSQLVGPADLTLASGLDPITLDQTENWVIKPQYKLAENTTHKVLGAAGGIFRVDIPSGDRFILTPSMLVAYNGIAPTTVYEQGRLDIVKAWLGWTRDGFRSIYLRSKSLAMSLVRTGSKYWRPAAAVPLIDETPSYYSKDPAYTIYWHRVKTGSRSVWVSTKEQLFYWTHPKKLQFDGPCSVLMRGRV